MNLRWRKFRLNLGPNCFVVVVYFDSQTVMLLFQEGAPSQMFLHEFGLTWFPFGFIIEHIRACH